MIPGKIVRFLEDRASSAFAGTRDANLVPRGHRVSGWRIGVGGRTVQVSIPEASVPHFVEAMEDNGRVTVTFEELGTHETYQLKGRYLNHRPAEAAEIDVANRLRERFEKSLRAMSPDHRVPELLGASIGLPRLVVEFEVHEVFLQTPGPGAGSRLAPPPGIEGSK